MKSECSTSLPYRHALCLLMERPMMSPRCLRNQSYGRKMAWAFLVLDGSSDRVLAVDNFSKIGDLAKSLLKKVCKTIEPPKPIPSSPWDPSRVRLNVIRLIDPSINNLEAFDAKGRSLRSLTHNQRSYVKFVNDSPYTVTLWWIDYKGKGRSYGDIAPRSFKDMATCLTHPWIVINKATGDFMLFTDAKGGTWPYFFPPSWNQPKTPIRVSIHSQNKGEFLVKKSKQLAQRLYYTMQKIVPKFPNNVPKCSIQTHHRPN